LSTTGSTTRRIEGQQRMPTTKPTPPSSDPHQPPLTTVDPEFDRAVRQTPSGMMHWSGTYADPGTTCSQCRHFKIETRSRGRCESYRRYTGTAGAAFEMSTAACKYFELDHTRTSS
jgi:hypothetical protein